MAAIFGEQPKEPPSVGLIRANAIAGLTDFGQQLARLVIAPGGIDAARNNMNILNNIERWRREQLGFFY